MRAAKGGRRIGAIAISVAVHVVVLTAAALYAPTLFIPKEPGGPPEPVIPILLVPRLPPQAAGTGTRPAPLRLHQRRLRPLPELPIAPLQTPTTEAPKPPPPPGPVITHRAPLPEAPRNDLSTALRSGILGCVNVEAAHLTASEREACAERLGAQAKGAPTLGLGLSQEKQGALDRAAAKKEADRRYRESPPPPGLIHVPGSSGASYEAPVEPLPERPRLPPG